MEIVLCRCKHMCYIPGSFIKLKVVSPAKATCGTHCTYWPADLRGVVLEID